MEDKGKIFVCKFNNWEENVESLFAASGLYELLKDRNQVLIKPNLVEALEPPITTPVDLVEAIVVSVRNKFPDIKIIVGEGTGAKEYDTFYPFETLGYVEMAARQGIELIDLNIEPLRSLQLPKCRRWPEMHLPEILFNSFLLSVPVLKAHSLASVTMTMKNMMGCAPPAHYQKGGHWKKASFHVNVQEAVLDLNRYRSPDFTLLDATIGMQEAHLWGPTCEPPHRKLAVSRDPVAIDAWGAGLLGRNWLDIGHLQQAHGELGVAEPLEIIDV